MQNNVLILDFGSQYTQLIARRVRELNIFCEINNEIADWLSGVLPFSVAEKDYYNAYQAAHKMKPTIDLFELGVLQDLIVVQDWGKFEKRDLDVSNKLELVLTAVENATNELKADFNL